MGDDLTSLVAAMQITVECDGHVTLRMPAPHIATEAPPVGGGARTTTVNCPKHGLQSFKETYDCESGQWELSA